MDKKEKLFNTLNNHFNLYNEFLEFSQIDEEDIEKIIALYEQEASKGGRDPWHYLYFDELIIMQMCVYEVIKNIPKYSEVTDKIETLYQKELDRRLQRPVLDYGEETGETYRTSYAEMPEYSLVLADMCSRHMQEAMDAEHMPLTKVEAALSTYESIKSDFTKVGKEMPEEQEHLALQTKTMVTLANKERNDIVERERQQREIELINLQQEINKMENERLEIEKRLKTISSETLGSYFSRQLSEKYPEEYQKFQQNKEQVRNYSSNAPQISDLKERFNKVAEDLKFYKGMLPVYESYYQRFKEIKNERQQQRVGGNEQVETLLNQRQAEEKARRDAQATRDELIGRAIRKDLMVPEDYRLSQIQVKNLSEQFAGYSNEELQKFITDSKKQEVTPEVQPPLARENSLQSIQQQTALKFHMSEVKQQPTSSYSNFEKNLISFIETRNSNLGKVSEVISVTGYPDSTYEIRFEDGKIHQITVTHDEEDMIRNQTQNLNSLQEQQVPHQQSVEGILPFQQTSAPDIRVSEIPQNSAPNPQEEKNKLINDIIDAMLKVGEFHDSGLDISQKMRDIEFAKKELESKSIEELKWTLSIYTSQQEEVNSTGGRCR